MKTTSATPLALAAFAAAQNSGSSLTDVLSGNNDTLSVLGGLLSTQPGLVDTLSGLQDITILAPSNDALNSFVESMDLDLTDLANQSDQLTSMIQALLTYHVINGTYSASDITALEAPLFAKTLLSNSTYENVTGSQVVEVFHENDTVSIYSWLRHQSNVTQADIEFDGGVIHVINEVLQIPQNVSSTAVEAGLSSLVGAIQQANILSDLAGLENITVFAPNNQAFANIASVAGNLSEEDLGRVLTYHVVEGTVGYSSDLMNGTLETLEGENLNILIQNGTVYVNDAQVVIADILISNGVVHVIDDVLNPDNAGEQADPSATTPAFPGATTATDGEIPFTSGVPTASSTPTGLAPGGGEGGGDGNGDSGDDEGAASHASAALLVAAFCGGVAILFSGL